MSEQPMSLVEEQREQRIDDLEDLRDTSMQEERNQEQNARDIATLLENNNALLGKKRHSVEPASAQQLQGSPSKAHQKAQDTKIEKLLAVNQKLRSKLKDLNVQVKRTLDKASDIQLKARRQKARAGRSQSPGNSALRGVQSQNNQSKRQDPAYQVRLKQNELTSVNKQIESQRKEILNLEKQVDYMSTGQRLGHMQNELKECQTTKTQLQQRIKQLTIDEKKQSQTLLRYMKEEEKQNMAGKNANAKSTVLLNELRVWKEKVSKLQAQRDRDETARKNQEVTTVNYMNENRQYIEQIQKHNNQTMSSQPDLARSQADREEEIARLSKRKAEVGKQLDEQQQKGRQEVRQMDRQLKDASDKLKQVNIQVREQEQHNRISKLKIKELRRQLKHNQLQPLQQSIDKSIISTNKSISQRPPIAASSGIRSPPLKGASAKRGSNKAPSNLLGAGSPARQANPMDIAEDVNRRAQAVYADNAQVSLGHVAIRNPQARGGQTDQKNVPSRNRNVATPEDAQENDGGNTTSFMLTQI